MKNTLNKLASLALAGLMMLAGAGPVFAAGPQNAQDNMTRQAINVASDHVIDFALTTDLLAGETVTVTFPADFTGAATIVSGAGWAAAGNVLTFTAPADITGGTALPTVTVTDLINPATVGNQEIDITSSNGDFGSITVPIIANDQIVVTARVASTLFFDVRDGIAGTATDNAVQFGTLESGNLNFATDTGDGNTTGGAASEFEIGTNSANGYFVDVTGDTLRSMEDDTLVIDPLETPAAAPAAGTEAFGIQIAQTQASSTLTPGSSDGVVSADYDGQYHHPGIADEVDIVASNVGPSDREIYDVEYIANIAPLTEAGNYATTFTFTATARF